MRLSFNASWQRTCYSSSHAFPRLQASPCGGAVTPQSYDSRAQWRRQTCPVSPRRGGSLQTKEATPMTTDKAHKLAALNDLCRKAMGVAGRICQRRRKNERTQSRLAAFSHARSYVRQPKATGLLFLATLAFHKINSRGGLVGIGPDSFFSGQRLDRSQTVGPDLEILEVVAQYCWSSRQNPSRRRFLSLKAKII
jgi:hypothetical protein